MKIVVSSNVANTLLQYYRELRFNSRYRITSERAMEKYSNFSKYIHSGIVADLPKGRPCGYRDMGQVFDKVGKAMRPALRYLVYQDESRTKWYISYVYDEHTDVLTVARVKLSGLVKCGKDTNNGHVLLSETQLKKIITESVKRILFA